MQKRRIRKQRRDCYGKWNNKKIIISNLNGRPPVKGKKLYNFKIFLENYPDSIIAKWVDYFVYQNWTSPPTKEEIVKVFADHDMKVVGTPLKLTTKKKE